MSEQIKLDEIVMLPEVQIRVKINPKVIEEYAASMAEGVKFNDVDIFIDDQERKILADGAHRVMAAQNRGLKTISATVHECEPAEAVSRALEMSLLRNGPHGLRLSPADKRKAVAMALEDKRIRKMGDKPISRLCGVSPQLVADVRKGEKEKDVPVDSHKRKKPSPRTITEEVVEDSDPTDERVRTLKSWVEEGKVSFPDVASVFNNDKRVALLIPRAAKVRVIGKKAGKEFEFVSIEMLYHGVESVLEIKLKSTEE